MTLKASCHCGATQLEAAEPPQTVTSCSCSICAKRGALWAYYRPDQVKLVTARDRVSTYQWGSYMMHLHFCGICGCSTYNEGPSWKGDGPDFDNPKLSINARLFDDFDLEAVPVIKLNGKDDW